MGFKCGIVGLPNVGKSTLFNALTASKNAEAANFPFCTIDPNIGIVDVPDERLDQLSKLSNSKKKIFANITVVDIAGLVKGASQGAQNEQQFVQNLLANSLKEVAKSIESGELKAADSPVMSWIDSMKGGLSDIFDKEKI